MESNPAPLPILLLVEDDAMLQELYAEAFRAAGFEVLQALDGQQALELVTARADIRLVVLDLMLPKVSGYDVLAHVRAAYGKQFPVIVVSALADIDDKARGLQLGATDYITKGDLPPAEVIEMLKKYAVSIPGPTE
jgi:DNA-binding response OmpR family regulator